MTAERQPVAGAPSREAGGARSTPPELEQYTSSLGDARRICEALAATSNGRARKRLRMMRHRLKLLQAEA